MPMTVPMSMHAEQRARLARTLREKSTVPDSSLVLMESARDAHRYDTGASTRDYRLRTCPHVCGWMSRQ